METAASRETRERNVTVLYVLYIGSGFVATALLQCCTHAPKFSQAQMSVMAKVGDYDGSYEKANPVLSKKTAQDNADCKRGHYNEEDKRG